MKKLIVKFIFLALSLIFSSTVLSRKNVSASDLKKYIENDLCEDVKQTIIDNHNYLSGYPISAWKKDNSRQIKLYKHSYSVEWYVKNNSSCSEEFFTAKNIIINGIIKVNQVANSPCLNTPTVNVFEQDKNINEPAIKLNNTGIEIVKPKVYLSQFSFQVP